MRSVFSVAPSGLFPLTPRAFIHPFTYFACGRLLIFLFQNCNLSEMTSSPTPSAGQVAEALAIIMLDASGNNFARKIVDFLPSLTAGNAADNDVTSTAGSTSEGYAASNDSEDTTCNGCCCSPCHIPGPTADLIFVEETQNTSKVTAYWGCEKINCPICDKPVTRKHLKSHLNMHLMYGNRPYPCKFCDKSFAYKKNLVSHMRTQHPGHIF